MRNHIIVFLFCLISLYSFGQNTAERKAIRKGNSYYDKSNYTDATKQDPKSERAKYNLGCADYQLKNFDKAAKGFEENTKSNAPKSLKSDAYHNLGNALLKSKKYEDAAQAYVNALKNNPSDNDTKYNLSYALKMLKKQNEDKKKNKDKDKKDNKNNKDNKKDQNKDSDNKDNKGNKDDKDKKGDQPKDNKDGKDNKNKGENKPQEGKEGNGAKPQPQQMSDAEAERILNSLKNKEQGTQKKMMLLNKPKKQKEIEKQW